MIGILLDDTYDIDLRSGRMALGEVTRQTTAIVAETMPGEIAEHPHIGLGLRRDLGGSPDLTLPTRAAKMLRDCALPCKQVIVEGNCITVIY